jgi:hypothetical protein
MCENLPAEREVISFYRNQPLIETMAEQDLGRLNASATSQMILTLTDWSTLIIIASKSLVELTLRRIYPIRYQPY